MATIKVSKLHKTSKDLTGLRFGRLVALVPTDRKYFRCIVWKCQCDCGNICFKSVGVLSRRAGGVRSCGCLSREANIKHGKDRIIHGFGGDPIYTIWYHMIQRCENPNNSQYKNYGARGIEVCERWHKIENFVQDMGSRPDGLTLERKNNDKGYCLENCKWATWTEQANNRRPASCGPQKQRWFRAWRMGSMAQWMSNNQREFAREHSLSNECVSLCLSGKQKNHKGWEFCRIQNGG